MSCHFLLLGTGNFYTAYLTLLFERGVNSAMDNSVLLLYSCLFVTKVSLSGSVGSICTFLSIAILFNITNNFNNTNTFTAFSVLMPLAGSQNQTTKVLL